MENLPQKKQEMLAGDGRVRKEAASWTLPTSPQPHSSLLHFYLRGSVSSRSTNPKEAYMSTSCSRRRVSCWEISNSYMEEGAS